MHQPLGRSHLLAPWKLFTGHAQLASRSSDETSSDHDLGRLNNLIDAINEQDASSLGPSAHAASSAHHLKQSFAVSLHVLFHSHQSNSSYSIDYSVATCKGSAVTFFASSSTWESKLWAWAPTSGLLASRHIQMSLMSHWTWQPQKQIFHFKVRLQGPYMCQNWGQRVNISHGSLLNFVHPLSMEFCLVLHPTWMQLWICMHSCARITLYWEG